MNNMAGSFRKEKSSQSSEKSLEVAQIPRTIEGKKNIARMNPSIACCPSVELIID